MSQEKMKKQPTHAILLAVAVLATLTSLAMITWQHELLLASILLIAGALVGFALGQSRTNAPPHHHMEQPQPQQEQPKSTIVTTPPADQHPARLLAVLAELQTLQDTDDLLQRYQAFIRVAEASLQNALGQATVSLWCPDPHYNTLVECVIPPAHKAHGRSAANILGSDRSACVVPFDSPAIRHALQTSQPFLRYPYRPSQPGTTALHCDACLWLEREFGRPLLVNVQLAQAPTGKKPRQDFRAACKLITLYWRQLQAANQRQWCAEHDQNTGALHPDQFLRKSQAWALDLAHDDEPFTLVTLAAPGFRATFAHHAQLWSQLTTQLVANLRQSLANATPHYLLGRMADDVFALFLPGKDAFLAQLLIDNMNKEISQPSQNDENITVHHDKLELRWALADHNQYADDLETMLNSLYRRLSHTTAARTTLPFDQKQEVMNPCK